ncbi:PD40 domain-containing protein [Dactylosporangium aurantiacum]|uniref:PD40 domain-containing protein n=1 Tax=Dactylosporangium aurantiacum TaxID=35754 RepID=A0A9Q9ITI9_9ACTN|nr:PD40 domain-containing protein [Dactylosporangium aurantiacum]MDG6108620.1 PD40 domain-containing protein [Dactylosporangium aurantiacum]UWZ59160.1 PD40 domain-containing protein [Dactylosporangium aurantiacum]
MNSTAITKALTLAGFTAVAGLGTMLAPAAAHAATNPDVYARAGVIYVNDGHREVRLTEDEVNAQPSLSPDGVKITYVHNGTIWVMKANGAGKHQVSDRTGTAPTWTPDGTSITYTAESCTGAPGTFRVGTRGGTTSEPLSPAECRDEAAPQVGYITEQPGTGPQSTR